MKFDLPSIIKRIEGLDDLTMPFTRQEMDLVIKEMPADRAPGPDGFPARFFQRNWATLKDSVIAAVKDFFRSGVMREGVNSTTIVLIPKVANPTKLTEYRPISL